MGLLSRSRRFLAPALLAVLLLPSLGMPITPYSAVSRAENRVLAPAPALPRSPAEWRRLPRALDAFAADHFALRAPLIDASHRVQRALGANAGPRKAVEGSEGWLFLSDGLLQSSGQIENRENVADYVAFVCDLHRRLAARGARDVFAPVPSPGEIYPEHLPPWAGPARQPTDYDRVLAGADACGLRAVDLRPALRAAKRQGLVYRRTDSHWTPLGAVIGFNAILEAIGEPDWRADVRPASWPARRLVNGDLPAMAALEPRAETLPVPESFERLGGMPRIPVEGAAYTMGRPFTIEGAGSGPTVLVIGDSFTENPMPPLFHPHVGRYAWAHHEECALDWTVIDKVKPDLVLIAPAEREVRCHGNRPKHMPPA